MKHRNRWIHHRISALCSACNSLQQPPNHLCLLVLFIPLLVVIHGCEQHHNLAPRLEHGVLDLSGWSFQSNGPLDIVGTSEFYWGKLLDPDEFSRGEPSGRGSLGIPSLWTDHNNAKKGIRGHGVATYRLVVKNVSSTAPLGLRISSLMGACRVWVNGELVWQNGSVAADPQFEIPGKKKVALVPCSLSGPPGSESVEIVVQLSNYSFPSGGTLAPFILGPEQQLTTQWNWERLLLVFSTTLLLVMGCYHLLFYCYRRQERALLCFSIFCLLWMLQLFSNYGHQWLIQLVFPNVGIWTGSTIEALCYFFQLAFFLLFLGSIYSEETPAWLPKIYLLLGILLSLLYLSSMELRRTAVIVGHLLTLVGGCWGVLIIYRAVGKKRQSARVLLAGCLVLALCGINDILTGLRLIDSRLYTSLGLLVFIATQASILARRFSRAFAVTEELSAELRQKNKALARVDRLKDAFIANTTHELCTPLSGIIGIAESMVAGATGRLPQSAVNNLHMIAASGRRLNSLIDNILDFSRLKHQDLNLVLRPVDLKRVIDVVLHLLSPLAAQKGLVLVNTLSDPSPLATADEDRLQQILYNLIGNAIKFTEKGTVTVSAVDDTDPLRVEIRDTGMGIPAEKQEQIFLYFEQVHGQGSGKNEGTGLGLPITKQLVELHHGTIGVESEPGRGTVVWFTLPAASHGGNGYPLGNTEGEKREGLPAPLPPVTYPEGAPDQKLPHGDQETVLVIDDEPTNLQVAVNHLTLAGFRVHTAPGGEAVLESMDASYKPDLILLDIMMPDMSGYEVCRRIRDRYEVSELPIIMLTARNRVVDLVKGYDSGANDYLSKPFSGDELIARVRTQLKISRAYMLVQENTRLRKEVAWRQRSEIDLKLTRQRLSRILDTLDGAVMAVNESLEISFSNGRCGELLGYDFDHMLGESVIDLFPSGDREEVMTLLNNVMHSSAENFSRYHRTISLLHREKNAVECTVFFAMLDVDHEPLLVLILKSGRHGTGAGQQPSQEAAVTFIEGLTQARKRFQVLEDTLHQLSPTEWEQTIPKDCRLLKTALHQMENTLNSADGLEKKRLAVEAMNLALTYWQQATGLGKSDLADQSGLWKVYINHNGFERTQTLDKYLDLNRLPKQPRWRKIQDTLDYVLLATDTLSPEREKLEQYALRLKMLR